MLMMRRAIACGFLLFSPCVYGQSGPLERRASSFNSKGVGLTETLLKFSYEEHLPIAIEYVDRASMDRPMNVSLRNKTIRQALDSILLNGNGYRWKLRNGIIEITNKHGSKHAEGLLNKVIPVFKIPEGETAQKMSTMLWWQVQIALDPSIKGFFGDIMGRSSTVKRSEEHTSELQSRLHLVCRLLLEKKNKK